jgi:hypothetical protein
VEEQLIALSLELFSPANMVPYLSPILSFLIISSGDTMLTFFLGVGGLNIT